MKTIVFQIYVVINVLFVTISTAQNYRIQNAIGPRYRCLWGGG